MNQKIVTKKGIKIYGEGELYLIPGVKIKEVDSAYVGIIKYDKRNKEYKFYLDNSVNAIGETGIAYINEIIINLKKKHNK